MFTYNQNQIASPLMFQMFLSTDVTVPVTGLTPTVTISKNGGSFAAPIGAIQEVGLGWYQVVPNIADFNTIGPLVLQATSVGADATTETFQVVSGLVQLGPLQYADIVGNVQGSVGSVLNPVTCKNKVKTCC